MVRNSLMRYFSATLVEKRQLNQDNFLLYFHDGQLAAGALPGQFAMIAADSEEDDPYPILMRPFSFFGVDESQGRFVILVKVVGTGTGRMSRFKPGDRIRMIGPLGNQFLLHPARRAVMVAGGVGIAPFYLLAQKLVPRGVQPVLFYGARSRNDLVTLQDFLDLGVEVHAATEDGSYGHQGLITAALSPYLREQSGCDLMACGPTPMLAALSDLARRHQIPLQVSVECYMGCGFGACFGCALETVEGLRLACRYGPIFDGHKLVWKQASHV
ncbi:MAG: dihydroorotate dehydrogenase electron transfer subunit [Acidobacteria bacterium]|nr:dihydroorotate dehydrogenase electron transfer subunit [Acidobacteriota bacterium]